MEVTRPIVRYHGGKWMLAQWIIGQFSKHRVYTESMGGGGSVLMQKARSYGEVYNDIWETIVNVFQVLRDPAMAAELERIIRLTPYSRREFESCIEQCEEPVEQARRTIVRSFMGFSSAATREDYPTGFRSNSNRSGTTPAWDWAHYPDSIRRFCERLQGVTIECRDYRDVLQQHDGPETLHFLDPPYVHETRAAGKKAYKHEFSDQDHIEMAETVQKLKGTVVICGYESELYASLFGDWRKIRRKAFADGAGERIECLWINRGAENLLF